MSTENHPSSSTPAGEPQKSATSGAVVSKVLHRVCIQCNTMFIVTPDKFDAKQCPNCHKG